MRLKWQTQFNIYITYQQYQRWCPGLIANHADMQRLMNIKILPLPSVLDKMSSMVELLF